MKKIFLMRHSIPEKGDMPNERIPLSEKGKALAVSKQNIFSKVDRCFSSSYRRAIETAECIADHPVIVEELHERTIGDAREDFWLKQYEDYDFRNPGGESLNQVKVRMKTAIDSIVGQMEEGETALVVSHATAICAYLLSYCEIEVKDAENKVRKISFHGKEILNGRFQPADGFEILFENDIFSDIRVMEKKEMNIKYNHLCIRNAEKKDCEQLAAWWNDGTVMAHAGFPNGLGTSAAEIEKQIADDSDETRRRLIIEYNDVRIGEMSFYVFENHRYEIGIKICESDYQEKGIGRVVLSMLIEELFRMGANAIFLDTNLKNTRAQHVYEKLGFRKTAVHHDSWKNQIGELESSVDYELTADAFCNLKERL